MRPPRGWAPIAALGITQTAGFGALYYSFGVLLEPVRADLGTSAVRVTAAFTMATLAGGVAAVPVGRLLDRRGARGVMTLGAAVAAVLFGALAFVHSTAWYTVVWVGVGLVSPAVLYEPAAFAFLVRRYGPRRHTAILAVTIVAGFASTVFLPLTAVLVERYGWRAAVLVLAAGYGALAVPLHAVALRSAGGPAEAPVPVAERSAAVRAALRTRAFWLLTAAFLAQGTAVVTASVHLVPALVSYGHPLTVAAAVTGLLGVLSVAGRLLTTALNRARDTARVTAAVFAVDAAGMAALPATGRHLVAAIACVITFGLGFGVGTLARPALLVDHFGTAAYGTLTGILITPSTVTRAVGPLAASAVLASTGSYTPVLLGVAAACALAACALLALPPPPPSPPPPPPPHPVASI